MSHRNPRQYLDPKEARCEARSPCAIKLQCARYLAPMQITGKSLGDWSMNQSPWAACPGFIDAARCKAPEPKAKAVHPPLGSRR